MAATQAQVNEFIYKIAPIAQAKASGRSKWSLPSVCIAQACCESSYGTSPKMVRANAVFGIKVGKSKVHFGSAWKDKAYSTRTKECYDGKTYTNITDMFRAYDSIEDSVEDYFDMLAACSRYKGCLNKADPKECITAIKDGGYATDPVYVSKIMSIVNKYNLMQFDSVVTGETFYHNTVKFSNRGENVIYLQKCLAAKGFSVGNVDGIFGKQTLQAVKEFQKTCGLSTDGIVGVKTWKALI